MMKGSQKVGYRKPNWDGIDRWEIDKGSLEPLFFCFAGKDVCHEKLSQSDLQRLAFYFLPVHLLLGIINFYTGISKLRQEKRDI